MIGHARVLRPGEDPEIEARLAKERGAKIEGIVVIDVVGYDWNCSQHITPRYTREELGV
jgi:hypothetical protein